MHISEICTIVLQNKSFLILKTVGGASYPYIRDTFLAGLPAHPFAISITRFYLSGNPFNNLKRLTVKYAKRIFIEI